MEIAKPIGEPEPVPVEGAAGAGTLKRDALTMPEVLAQSVANMAPTAAMALLALLVFTSAGNGTWVSFVIAVVLMVCVGYCATQFAKRMTSAGSFYVWVSRALGPLWGHLAGWGLQLGYVATGIATVIGFGIFGNDFLSHFGVPAANPAVQVVLYAIDFALPVAVAIMDMGLSARTSLVLEGVSVAIILFLCVAIWVHQGTVFDTRQLSLQGVGPGGVFVGVVLAIFAFVGFESAGSLGMEARNPYRSVGRAILWSCILVGLFYVVVSYSQVFGFRGSSAGFAKSQAPLPDLSAIVGLGWLAPVISLGITCSMFACTLACTNAAARMAFAMAHDGMGAEPLRRTHPRHRTPHVGIWIAAIPMFVIPVLLILAGQAPVESTGWAGTVATFGFMLAYALVSVAAPVFLGRTGQQRIAVVVVGTLGALVMAFVFWSNWLPQTIPGGLFPALTGVVAWLPYLFFAWVAIGAIWYFIVRSRNPEVARQIGSRFEEAS